jgi:hypothetical protein
MIFNSTYTDKEKKLEVEKLIGKRYSIFSSIRLNGVGSKRLIIEETSPKFKEIIIQKNDLIYSNIEIRYRGIIVYIAEGLNRFSWAIPYDKLVVHKTPNYRDFPNFNTCGRIGAITFIKWHIIIETYYVNLQS